METKWICLFWGTMDLFYIGRFLYVNYAQGKIPLYSDIESFLALISEHDPSSVLFFLLLLTLNISILVSAFFLFFRPRSAKILIFFQAPLRLFLAVPSLTFLPWLIKVNSVSSTVVLFGLLAMSETVKVCSVVLLKRITASR